MRGEISLPVTDMNGMWMVKTQYVQVGSSSFTGNSLTTVNFVPNPIDGYKPIGVIGYATSNANENGVIPKDSSGKSYSGNSWLCPVQCYYDPNKSTGVIQVRNYSNTGSTSTVNREGGGSVTCFVCVWILYVKSNGAFVPSSSDMVDVSSVSLNYGVTATIVTYGRVCQILINMQASQNIPADAVIGTVPKPAVNTYAPNAGGNSFLYVSGTDSTLRAYSAISSGSSIICTFNYITA